MALLSDNDVKDLKAIFDMHDIDRVGRIPIKSANHVAVQLGYDPHDKDAPA